MSKYFNSDSIITEHISEAQLKAYFVGFDFGVFRYEALTNKIMEAIVDFAFGCHEGILSTYKLAELRDAAQLIYKIEEYDPNNKNHLKKGNIPYKNAEEFKESRYYNRGEFGELILHLILRDFMETTPLLSKIFMKDSTGITVKGLDAVHIGRDLSDPTKKSLYLGESKLHRTGETGVKELLKDVKEHFNRNFLKGEFLLIGNKKNNFLPIDEYKDKNTIDDYKEFIKEKNYWYNKLKAVQKGEEKLQDIFSSVTIPMICTYTSALFETHTDESTDEFKSEFKKEIESLQKKFQDGVELIKQNATVGEPIATDLNIILMLFPIPDKKILVKKLHEKLSHQQRA
ncbi:HamA C-terminal domain-containing protein [Psychromonas hadalis]|uniref:HamA C-terminal domain-containing protein n=1 Tax=Psychromonas hadalis TaxID=211669 RepID=UPI0003B67499|nr:DUF1837 domain-containing protein [Psychromonas hadalis]